jgi:hypothetical protein
MIARNALFPFSEEGKIFEGSSAASKKHKQNQPHEQEHYRTWPNKPSSLTAEASNDNTAVANQK